MDKVVLLSLASDLKRIVMSIQRGSEENSRRFTQEAERWLAESSGVKDKYLKKLLAKVKAALKTNDTLEKAEDCLMYSVLLQNQALFNSEVGTN